jgi:hypothetical protein
MKKLIPFLAIAIVITVSSCAPGPVGIWNYSVTGTPQGDYKGLMTISKTETGYAAKMSAEGSEIPFDKFEYVKSTKKAAGNFSFQGTPIGYSATLNKDELNGSIDAGGMEFPIVATRKK